MIAFIIKSTLCLIVLLGIYWLFLEREKMHQFNRFFLLGALVLGLSVPFINLETFTDKNTNPVETQLATEIVRESAKAISAVTTNSTEFIDQTLEPKPTEAIPAKTSISSSKESQRVDVEKQPKTINDKNTETAKPSIDKQSDISEKLSEKPVSSENNIQESVYPILFSPKNLIICFYMVVTLILGIRFVHGLIGFYRRRKSSTLEKYGSATIALLKHSVVPHTFLNTIFVNKDQFQSGELSREILDHELTHAKQKHSLDVLFIEFLKIVFWFNPVFYFYKQAIQINHEFLADESVITKTNDSVSYQKLLLDTVFPAYQTSLASTFNYSLTKKRFKMMVKESSIFTISAKKTLLIPIVGCVVFIFCTKVSTNDSLYILEGEEYAAFQTADGTYSEEILLNKIEDKDQFKNPLTVKFYDQKGTLFTGEWQSYFKNERWFFEEKEEAKPHSKFTFDEGMLVTGLIKSENGKDYVLIENEFRGDTLMSELVSKNDSIRWKKQFIPEKDITVIQEFRSGKLSYEYSTSGDIRDLVYTGLATRYDSLGNIEAQELYDTNGKQIPLTDEYLQEELKEVQETYLQSISEYFGLELENYSEQQLGVKYSEVMNNRSKLIAFQKRLNPETNRADEILIPRKRFKKKSWEKFKVWSSDKIYEIDGTEFIEAGAFYNPGYSNVVLYNLVEERENKPRNLAPQQFKNYDNKGNLFTGTLFTYSEAENSKPMLYADESEGTFSKRIFEKGKMLRSIEQDKEGNNYLSIAEYEDDKLKSDIGFINDTLWSKVTIDLETNIRHWYSSTDDISFSVFSSSNKSNKFKSVGLSISYFEKNNINSINLHDNEGNDIPITEEYLEEKLQEYELKYDASVSNYLNIEAAAGNREKLNIAYWDILINQRIRHALEQKLDSTGKALPSSPKSPSPDQRIKNTN